MTPLAVVCADIGSVRRNSFAWAETLWPDAISQIGTDMAELAERAAQHLNTGLGVAFGIEAPLYVPLVSEWQRLPSARVGEGDRAWCSGAGPSVLATGVVQFAWLLAAIRARLRVPCEAFVTWSDFAANKMRGLFVWEAFVTKNAKRGTHVGDAQAGVEAFVRALPDPSAHTAISDGDVFSLAGAALIRTGWTTDTEFLGVPCTVIRA